MNVGLPGDLAELARRVGIELGYWHVRGHWVEVTVDALLAVLRAMGHVVDRPDDARAAPWDSTGVLARHSPLPSEWDRVRSIEAEAGQAKSDLAREDARLAERLLEIERRTRYLESGARDAAASPPADR